MLPSRYELQRGVSTTSSQLDETEQPSVGTTDLEDGDVSPKEVGCLAISGNMGQKRTFDTLHQQSKVKLTRRILTLTLTNL